MRCVSYLSITKTDLYSFLSEIIAVISFSQNRVSSYYINILTTGYKIGSIVGANNTKKKEKTKSIMLDRRKRK